MQQAARFPGIDRHRTDDDAYVACVERIVAGMVFRFRPARVCVVRVKRWFDHRWLGFSGKGRVPFDSPFLLDPGVALDEVYADQLTFPPFAPTRIASEDHWSRRADGDYERIDDGFRVHRSERTHSATNLHRRVADVTDAGLFVWFSSGDVRDGRGSVMVHSVCDGAALPWFVSLVLRDGRWDAAEVKGLGRQEVRELLEHPPGIGRREP
jgi:hypothetical protein